MSGYRRASGRMLPLRFSRLQVEAILGSLTKHLAGGEAEHRAVWGDNWQAMSSAADSAAERLREALAKTVAKAKEPLECTCGPTRKRLGRHTPLCPLAEDNP